MYLEVKYGPDYPHRDRGRSGGRPEADFTTFVGEALANRCGSVESAVWIIETRQDIRHPFPHQGQRFVSRVVAGSVRRSTFLRSANALVHTGALVFDPALGERPARCVSDGVTAQVAVRHQLRATEAQAATATRDAVCERGTLDARDLGFGEPLAVVVAAFAAIALLVALDDAVAAGRTATATILGTLLAWVTRAARTFAAITAADSAYTIRLAPTALPGALLANARVVVTGGGLRTGPAATAASVGTASSLLAVRYAAALRDRGSLVRMGSGRRWGHHGSWLRLRGGRLQLPLRCDHGSGAAHASERGEQETQPHAPRPKLVRAEHPMQRSWAEE
jgi:hypothetical protein